MRACKDERTRERVWGQESKRTCGDKETKKMWRHGTQERVETREHENMWLKKKTPPGNRNKIEQKKKVIVYYIKFFFF